jgi:hypothetical protein
MNHNHSNHTGRVHRTMESAFGPYSRGAICEPYTPMTMADKVVVGVSIVVMIGLLIALLVGAL